MTYYEPASGMTLVPLAIERRGLPVDNAVLALAGIYPLDHAIPAYDATYYRTEPSGSPHPKPDSPNVYVQDFNVVPRDIASVKDDMKNEASQKRYTVETSGIEFQGSRINTERSSQALINGAVVRGLIDQSAIIEWKTEDGGKLELTAEMAKAVGIAVSTHVETCFSRELALIAEIDACTTIEQLQAVDIDSGWPTNGGNA